MEDPRDKKEGAPAHPTVEPPVPHVDAPYSDDVPTQPMPIQPPGGDGSDANPELKIRR